VVVQLFGQLLHNGLQALLRSGLPCFDAGKALSNALFNQLIVIRGGKGIHDVSMGGGIETTTFSTPEHDAGRWLKQPVRQSKSDCSVVCHMQSAKTVFMLRS